MTVALPTRMVEKPWGKDLLPPPFASRAGDTSAAKRIGEIWFEPPADLSALLVKYIFTSEALSVQVHPSDAQTMAAGLGRQGKEECWLVIAADPGARIGIGFTDEIGAAAMRAAALDGSIEHLLAWHDVVPGDFFYIPANTVHAIGAGVSLIEIQQNSDITYRLYDYGRPRELHLDEGVVVAIGAPYPETLHRRVDPHSPARLVDGPFFRIDRIAGAPAPDVLARYGPRPLLAIPLAGTVMIDGETIVPGACARLDRADAARFSSDGMTLLAQPTGSAG